MTTPSSRLAMIRADFRRRLLQGEAIDAESVLSRFEDLRADPATAVELILVEFEVRAERGEHPDPEFWLLRFHRWREPLRQRFEAMALRTAVQRLTPPARRPPSLGPDDDLPRLGAFELLEVVGRGGMGVVYRARDLALERDVALKVLRGGSLAGPGERRRFTREARAAARLRHPNIVPVLGFGMVNGEEAFAMPLMAGTLAARLGRPLPPAEVVGLVLPLAAATGHAHTLGIVHRDLKPSNILLDEYGVPYVADFGLARDLDRREELTRSEGVVGTPAYMAPEQADLRSRVGPPADVYALGLILLEALTGGRPAAEYRRDGVPEWRLAGLPAGLDVIVRRCLERKPADRYPDGARLADDLRRWRDGEPLRTPAPPARLPAWFGPQAALAAFFVPLMVAVAASAPDPGRATPRERVAADQDAALRRGEPVTLVRSTGLPRLYRWRVDEERPGLIDEPRLPLKIDAWWETKLELLAAVPVPRYHLEAEVKRANADSTDTAGVYVLGERLLRPGRLEYRFYQGTVGGRDRGRLDTYGGHGRILTPDRLGFRGSDRSSIKRVIPELLAEARLVAVLGLPGGALHAGPTLAGLFAMRPGGWNRLDVSVTPNRVVTWVNGLQVATWDRTNPAETPGWARQPPNLQAAPRPAGTAVGLYVPYGTAMFRRVVLRPRP